MDEFNEFSEPDRNEDSDNRFFFSESEEKEEFGFEPLREWDGEDHDEDEYEDLNNIPAPREFLEDMAAKCLRFMNKIDNGESPTFGDFLREPFREENDDDESEENDDNNGLEEDNVQDDDQRVKCVLDYMRSNTSVNVLFEENLKLPVSQHHSQTRGTALVLKLQEELKIYNDKIIGGFIDDLYLTLLKHSQMNGACCSTVFSVSWSNISGVKLELPSTLVLTENPNFIYLMIGDMLLELADKDKEEINKAENKLCRL